MKKISFFITMLELIFIGVLFSGCSNKSLDQIDISEEDQKQNYIIDTLIDQSQSEMVNDGTIIMEVGEEKGFPSKCKIYWCEMKNFTEDQIISLFDETPIRNERSTTEWSEYTNKDQRGLLSENSSLTFYSQVGDLYDTVYSYFSANSDYKELVDEDCELSFATREEVIEKIDRYMDDNFDIKPFQWEPMGFYAVKKDTVDSYKKLINEIAEGNDSADNNIEQEKAKQQAKIINNLTSDEFYYIKLRFKIDGIPIYWGKVLNYGSDAANTILGPEGYLVFTRRGVEYIALYFVNEIDSLSANNEEKDLIGLEKARNLFLQRYNDVIFEGEIKISDIYLVYLPIPHNDLDDYYKHIEMRPFYAFDCKQIILLNEGTYEYGFISYFDAITGRDLGDYRS